MTAFHSMMLSGHGLPEIPPGGSLDRRLKSRIRRLLQLVDWDKNQLQDLISGSELTMLGVTGEVTMGLGSAFCARFVPPTEP